MTAPQLVGNGTTIEIIGRVHTSTGKALKGIAVSNGEQIVRTDPRGRFTLQADPVLHPFIFATQPDGFADAGWYVHTPTASANLELTLRPLRRRPSPSRAIRIGHITDLHLGVNGQGPISPGQLARDLERTHAEAPPLDLLVATGDLTNRGDLPSLRALQRTLSRSPVPVVAHFGGHDGNHERKSPELELPYIQHWEQAMGPTYFSLELGAWHLIICPDEDGVFGPQRAAAKRRWLEADLALAARRRILLAQHCPPPAQWLEFLAKHGVEVLLFGHWHSSKCYRHAGILVVGTPALVFGGIDTMPRGLRIVELRRTIPRTFYLPFMRRRFQRPRSNPHLRIRWRASAPTPLSGGKMLAADGAIFVPLADEDPRGCAGVLCLDAESGKRKWLAVTPHSVRGSLVLADERLLLVTQTGELAALDRRTGRKIWLSRLNGYPDRWIYTGPAVVGGTVIAGTGGGGVQAFDLRTGDEQWRWQHPEGTSDSWSHYTTPLTLGKNVIVMVHRKGVSCLTAKTGRPRWHFESYYDYRFAPMILGAGKLFVPDRDGQFHAVDPASGRRLWTQRIADGFITAWTCDDHLLMLNTTAGMAQARRATSGHVIWQCTYGRDLADMVPYTRCGANALASPILSPQAVYLAGLDGRLRAVTRNTGAALAALDLGEPIVATATVSARSILLATYLGSLIRVEADIDYFRSLGRAGQRRSSSTSRPDAISRIGTPSTNAK